MASLRPLLLAQIRHRIPELLSCATNQTSPVRSSSLHFLLFCPFPRLLPLSTAASSVTKSNRRPVVPQRTRRLTLFALSNNDPAIFQPSSYRGAAVEIWRFGFIINLHKNRFARRCRPLSQYPVQQVMIAFCLISHLQVPDNHGQGPQKHLALAPLSLFHNHPRSRLLTPRFKNTFATQPP